MNLRKTFLGLFVLTSLAAAAPAVQFTSCDGSQETTLRATTDASCVCVNRALNAIQNHLDAVKREFKPNLSINFNVLYKNPAFYLRRLGNRAKVCNGGKVKYQCVGLCNTPQMTLAYVKVYFGIPASTVNVCNEFFPIGDERRQETITHEMGRLENIGDSPNFDTDNIYVWDAIVQRLCEESTYRRISSAK